MTLDLLFNVIVSFLMHITVFSTFSVSQSQSFLVFTSFCNTQSCQNRTNSVKSKFCLKLKPSSILAQQFIQLWFGSIINIYRIKICQALVYIVSSINVYNI